jgi:hypothetical protein
VWGSAEVSFFLLILDEFNILYLQKL